MCYAPKPVEYTLSKTKKPLTFGELLFFCVWLTGWSCGVAVIQGIALASPYPTFIWIFVLSHGGSEVLVLWNISSRLRSSGTQVQRMVEQQEMESMLFRWRLGDKPRPFTALLAAALAMVTYCILFAPSVLYILGAVFGIGLQNDAELSVFGLLACCLFGAVWIYTITWWIRAYIAVSKGFTIVNLRVEPHRIVIEEERIGPDTQPIVFPATGLHCDTANETLALWTETQRWERPYPTSLHSMVQGIQKVIEQGQKHGGDGHHVPEALTQLIRATQEDGEDRSNS